MDDNNQQQPKNPPKNDNSGSKNGPQSEISKTLKDTNNILVIISRDPSIDQLSASIGLTVALNKAGKHATAVYSGKTPPVIEFLEPDKTLEKNTDSLRDFIISLDKSKADKLRYKVEDNVVRIFITPYKTSISDKDLEFSQGDFNVDAVVAIGVHDRGDLDQAIADHGRILHDAPIISLSTSENSELGSIHWTNQQASSLSEMVTDLITTYDKKLLDSQSSTALLTGIVYETDRFRNEKSAPHTMSITGHLMEAGASTQLVSSKLEEKHEDENSDEIPEVSDDQNNDGNNDSEDQPDASNENQVENSEPEPPKDPGLIEIDHDDQIHIDDEGKLKQIDEILAEQEEKQREQDQEQPQSQDQAPGQVPPSSSMIYEPPKFGGQLTANSEKVDQQYANAPDPLSAQNPTGPTLAHDNSNQTLTELEKSVNSPHMQEYKPDQNLSTGGKRVIQPLSAQVDSEPGQSVPPVQPIGVENANDQNQQVEYAQSAVERAVASADYRPEPIQALGAQPVGLDLGKTSPDPVITTPNPSGPPPPPVPPPFTPGQ